MDVQVRDRLTYYVVDCDESALGAQRRADRDCDPLGHGQQRNHEIAGKGQQCVDVMSWSDEYVPLEHRTVIEESDHLLIARHDCSVQLAAHDLADHIAHRHEINARAQMDACRGRVSCARTLRHDLVMTHREITLDEEVVVLGIEDSVVDLVAGECADAVPGVPQ